MSREEPVCYAWMFLYCEYATLLLLRHIVVQNQAGLERYFSVRERPAMKSRTDIGLGKKQREWAGVQIGDIVKGTLATLTVYCHYSWHC